MVLEPRVRWRAALLRGEGPNSGFQSPYRQIKNVPTLIISHSVISLKYDNFQDWSCGKLAVYKRNVQRSELKFLYTASHMLLIGLWKGARAGLKKSVMLCNKRGGGAISVAANSITAMES